MTDEEKAMLEEKKRKETEEGKKSGEKNNKRRRNNNKRGKNNNPKPNDKVERTVSSIFSLLAPQSDFSVTATNAKILNIGGTDSAIECAIAEVSVRDPLDPNAEALATPLVDRLISAYYMARGYLPVAPVVAANIFDYVEASFKAWGILLHMLRSQSAAKIEDHQGRKIGVAFASRSEVTTFDVANKVKAGASTEANFDNFTLDGSVSISNAEWAKDWLSHLIKIKMPKSWVDYGFALYSGVFKIPSTIDTYIQFVPRELWANDSAKNLYDAQISVLDGFLAKPEFHDLLDLLGFTNEFVIQMDYTRDIKGQTLSIYEDSLLPLILRESYIYPDGTGFASDDDIRDIVYVEGSGDHFDYLSFEEFPVDKVMDLISSGGRYAGATAPFTMLNGVKVFTSANTTLPTVNYVVTPGCQIYFDGVSIATPAANQVNAAATIKAFSDIIYGDVRPSFSVNYLINEVAGNWAFGYYVSSIVSETGRVWRFDYSSMYQYFLDRNISRLFNFTPWRESLQMLTNALRPQTINKPQ